jgi:hypothetical protein
MVPSNPKPLPTSSPDLKYPFEMVCANYFRHSGIKYLVVVNRVLQLRRTFVTFGIPTELASDGSLEFMATETQSFMKDWGISHRLLSVVYPHSNCCAEVEVKTAKRLIMENTDTDREIDIPRFQQAMLQYCNTQVMPGNMSPAQIVFGQPIRDFIPVNHIDLTFSHKISKCHKICSEHPRDLIFLNWLVFHSL